MSAACGSLLGIDPGHERSADAGITFDATPEDALAETGDDGSTCTRPPTLCAGKCGLVADPCGGKAIDCGTACPANTTCNTTSNTCTCAANPAFCTNRCGAWKDDCGNDVVCPDRCPAGAACPGGPNGICGGCVPDTANDCAGRSCGSVVDPTCNVSVACGVNGTTQCDTTGAKLECDPVSGTCCAPSNPCTGGNCGLFSDGCQGSVQCQCTVAGAACSGGVCTTCAPLGRPCVDQADCCVGASCASLSGGSTCYGGACTDLGTACDPQGTQPCCAPYHCVGMAVMLTPPPDGGPSLDAGTGSSDGAAPTDGGTTIVYSCQ